MKKGVGTYTLVDAEFIRRLGVFAEYGLMLPSDLQRGMEALREWKGSDAEILEFFLQRFETMAQHHIDALWGADGDPDPDEDKEEAAEQVLLSCDLIRAHAEKERPEAAAIEMVKLIFAGVMLNSHDVTVTGVRAKLGQTKGGRKAVDKTGYLIALESIEGDLRVFDPKRAWDYFERHHPGEEHSLSLGECEVFFYEDQLYQIHESGTQRQISFNTFRRYFHEYTRKKSAQ